MAGILNSVYVLVTTLVALAGLFIVANAMNDVDSDGPNWVDWSVMVIAGIFLVALAAGFMT